LAFSNNYSTYFSPENPDLVDFDNFQDTYTKNDNILFVVQPAEGSIFTPRMAEAIEWLTTEAWRIPYTIRVDSITNFQHSSADGDDLTVADLIRGGADLSQSKLDDRKRIALAEPLLNGSMISPDTRTAGLNVTLQYPEASLMEVPETAAYARNLASQLKKTYPGVTVATLLVVDFSTVTALGLAGYLGLMLDPIAIADSIHILVSMLTLMRDGKDKIAALKESITINFLPVAITSATTIVGFLALNSSDSPPFWNLGNITAMGIFAALIYSVTLMPALVSLLPVRVKGANNKKQGWPDQMSTFVVSRRRPILATTAALTLIFAAFVPTLDLNDEWVKYFDHRVQFRTDAEFGINNLNGIYVVEYSVEAGEPGAISEPEYISNLEKFTAWLREQPEVTHVYSYSDIIKRLNKNMHGDDASWYAVPEERDLAAQYLLLFELSLPFGLDLNDRINIDKSATRVTATVGQLPTVQLRQFLERSKAWLVDNAPEYMRASPTGASVMFSYISERNIRSMLGGNMIAVLLIALIMMVALRSLPLGAMSLIPNLVPILMTFGIWAVFVGQVGMAAATVSATSLGIVVDSTVHFLAKYLRARREKNYSRPDAIRYTFQMVGRALVINALILAFGFAVLAFSTFRINSEMGLLTAIAIVIALAVDFLLLPALLLIGYKKEEETSYADQTVVQAA